ncbi:MAG TPA: NADH-quinone oxidoreductase subunit J [Bacteroidia bacterium]|nr:NADH-quinone oxidoreductase subunit J [Bacteroidia bacterium]
MNLSVTEILFGILSLMAIFSGICVIFSRNPVFSVLYLIITFFCIAGHYILLNAQFLAVVHIIVYAGAIMVLFLFVIMMLNLNKETEPTKPVWIQLAAVFAGGILMITLVASLKGAETIALAQPQNSNIGLVENLGKVLFTNFLVPFELSSVLFLSAMVGSVMLGKKHIQ